MTSAYETLLLIVFGRHGLSNHPGLRKNLSLETVLLLYTDHIQAIPLRFTEWEQDKYGSIWLQSNPNLLSNEALFGHLEF